MKTVLQINSIDALNKLIEKDEKLELEIRNNVANALVKNSLKSIINKDFVQIQAKIIKDEVAKELFTKLPDSYWENYTLSNKGRDLVKDRVETIINSTINKIVRETVEQYLDSANLDEIVNNKIEYFTNTYIEEKIKHKLRNMISSL